MRLLSMLVAAFSLLAIAGCGPRAEPKPERVARAEPKPPSVARADVKAEGAGPPELMYEGMPLGHWIAQTKDTSPTFRRTAATALSHMAPDRRVPGGPWPTC